MVPRNDLSRRERQIMDVIYARGEASADDVVEGLAEPPTRTAVRTFLGLLEAKGLVKHEKRGRMFVYRPTRPTQQVGKGALRRVLETFFGGSLEEALAAHLTDPAAKMSEEEYERLMALIRQARNTTKGKS
jgi:BlaI family transcriptional regulator, penicillinase repressor